MAEASPEYEKHRIGNYLVIGNPGNYKVMQQFGSYRMLKKTFKTLAAATTRAEQMMAQDANR